MHASGQIVCDPAQQHEAFLQCWVSMALSSAQYVAQLSDELLHAAELMLT